MTDYQIPMLFSGKNSIPMSKTPNFIPMTRLLIYKWAMYGWGRDNSNKMSFDTSEEFGFSGIIGGPNPDMLFLSMPSGRYIHIIDSEYAYGLDQIGKKVYKYNISKQSSEITEKSFADISSIVLHPVYNNILLIGLNKTYIYMTYMDDLSIDHMLLIKKFDMSVFLNLVGDSVYMSDKNYHHMTNYSQNKSLIQVSDNFVITYNVYEFIGNELVPGGADRPISLNKFRLWNIDMSSCTDIDPEVFAYLGTGPFIYDWTDMYSQPAYASGGSSNVTNSNENVGWDVVSKFSIPSGIYVYFNRSTGLERGDIPAGSYDNTCIPASRSYSLISNKDYIIATGPNLTCFDKTGVKLWTIDAITTSTMMGDYWQITASSQGISSCSMRYISEYNIMLPLSIVGTNLICLEYHSEYSIGLAPARDFLNGGWVHLLQHNAFRTLIEPNVIIIELLTGNILYRKRLFDYKSIGQVEIIDNGMADPDVHTYLDYIYYNTFGVNLGSGTSYVPYRNYSCIGLKSIFQHSLQTLPNRISEGGGSYGFGEIFDIAHAYVGATTISHSEDGDKQDIVIEINCEDDSSWEASVLSGVFYPIVIKDELYLFRFVLPEDHMYLYVYSLIDGTLSRTIDITNYGELGARGFMSTGFNKMFFNNNYGESTYLHQVTI